MKAGNWKKDFADEGEAWIKLPILASLNIEFHQGESTTDIGAILNRVKDEYRRRGGLTETQAIAYVESTYPDLDLDREVPVFGALRPIIEGSLEGIAEDLAEEIENDDHDDEEDAEREERQSQGYICLRDEEGYLESATQPLEHAVKALEENEKQVVEDILHRFESDFVTKEDLRDIGPPQSDKTIRNMVACNEIIVCEEVAADINYLEVWFSVAWDEEHEYKAILHGARVVDLIDSGTGWSDPDHP